MWSYIVVPKTNVGTPLYSISWTGPVAVGGMPPLAGIWPFGDWGVRRDTVWSGWAVIGWEKPVEKLQGNCWDLKKKKFEQQ